MDDKQQWWSTLTAEEKDFWRAMAETFGPLKYEDYIPEGVIVKDYQPHGGEK